MELISGEKLWTQLENEVIDYIEKNYKMIEDDMNLRNSSSKSKNNDKTRKKREELSISASKTIFKENIEIVVSFK